VRNATSRRITAVSSGGITTRKEIDDLHALGVEPSSEWRSTRAREPGPEPEPRPRPPNLNLTLNPEPEPEPEPLSPDFVKRPMRGFIFAFAMLRSSPRLGSAGPALEWMKPSTSTHASPLDPGGPSGSKASGRVTITASIVPEVVIDAVRRASRERLNRHHPRRPLEGSHEVVIEANHPRALVVSMFTGKQRGRTDSTSRCRARRTSMLQ